MNTLLPLAIVGPIVAACLGLLAGDRHRLRDAITLAGIGSSCVSAALILFSVRRDGAGVLHVGGWNADAGIVLVADLFSALVLLVATTTILLVEIFAIGQRRTAAGADPKVAGPMLGVLTSGVCLSILTGDLFTLFVAFELILVSSYVLLTHQARRDQVRSGMTYVVINLLASTLFLFGIAYVYGATGTVNLALLAQRLPDLDSGVRLGIGAWFLVVFGIKAAMFPLFSWLPDSYPTAPTTITAVFAGLLTKIGLYVLIRFHTLMGMDELGGIILVAAGFTMVIGVAGALAQDDVKRILSFHVVSQIGYMLMGLGLFSIAGIAGAVIFIVHHIPVKTVLFLVGGLIEHDQRTSSLDRIGGIASRKPFLALLFAIPALSLGGIPPFSGFVAKLALVDAGLSGAEYAIVATALFVGLLTLLSMTKIWIGVFWRTPTLPEPDDMPVVPGAQRLMYAATTATVVMSLTITVFAGTLWNWSMAIATDLMNPSIYIQQVLG